MVSDDKQLGEDQPAPTGAEVIELADMTDEQQRIVESGNTIAGSFPKNLSKEALREFILRAGLAGLKKNGIPTDKARALVDEAMKSVPEPGEVPTFEELLKEI